MLKLFAFFSRSSLVAIFVALLASCTSSSVVSSVDSLSQPDSLTKKRYIISPGARDVQLSDLQFQEFASYIEKALSENGFVRLSNFDEADIAIILSYGIGSPQTHQYSYSLPVWGQTGVSSSYTSGTVSTVGGFGAYSGTTTYTPTYGITGYSTHLDSYTTYPRFLLMEAYDIPSYKKEKRMKQVWKISVASTGSSDDLRHVFPYMVVAMKPYIGNNTGNKVEVEIDADDPQVVQLRGAVSSPVPKR